LKFSYARKYPPARRKCCGLIYYFDPSILYMKTLIPFAILVLSLYRPCFAADDRNVTKGTVLNYTIKDGAVSYKLKATVTEWNPDGNIKIQWQTTGAKVTKGTCTLPYQALESATEMKIKLKPGNETLTENFTRWFAGYETYDYLHNIGIESDLKIDDKDVTIYPDEDVTEKDILYNNVKTEMDYTEGTNDESSNKISIGFIEYADKIIILDRYENGSFSMNLVSIVSPVVKTAEDYAKEILDAIAPKGKVVLKKMEPKKFAVVKSKYPLLATIENYDATKGGSIKKPITETYEYRVGSSSPNPPSLIDCLTTDVQIIYNQKTNFGITDMAETIEGKSLPSSVAKRILQVYMVTDYNKLPGFRPWTHWSFIRGLSEDQRTQLAKELEGYVAQYGFISE
jgi:hypothetical protein